MKIIRILNVLLAIGFAVAYFGYDCEVLSYGLLLGFYLFDRITNLSIE